MEFLLSVLLFLGACAVSTLLSAVALWFGTLAAAWYAGYAPGARYCTFGQLWLIAAVAGVLGLMPWIGWLLAFIAVFMLLRKFADADFKEVALVVVVSRIAAALMWAAFIIGYSNTQHAFAS